MAAFVGTHDINTVWQLGINRHTFAGQCVDAQHLLILCYIFYCRLTRLGTSFVGEIYNAVFLFDVCYRVVGNTRVRGCPCRKQVGGCIFGCIGRCLDMSTPNLVEVLFTILLYHVR